MKIIGYAGERKPEGEKWGTERVYLVEASGDELAQLAGHASEYDMANRTLQRAFEVGAKIRLKGWRDAQRQFHAAASALYSMPEKLRELATHLEARTPKWEAPKDEGAEDAA